MWGVVVSHVRVCGQPCSGLWSAMQRLRVRFVLCAAPCERLVVRHMRVCCVAGVGFVAPQVVDLVAIDVKVCGRKCIDLWSTRWRYVID